MNTDFSHSFFGWNSLSNIDLSTVRGLDRVVHFGPSSVGIDTIYKSKGAIPDLFLAGAGTPDAFIFLNERLTKHQMQLFTCFIRYERENQEFAEHLYTHLQQNGIRCWLAPEDVRGGINAWGIIYRSTMMTSSLVLILSEESIYSGWFQEEVSMALKMERIYGKRILFPICLNIGAMEKEEIWASELQSRQLSDFSEWKEKDRFESELTKLANELKGIEKTENDGDSEDSIDGP
jgi:hypothetical protein